MILEVSMNDDTKVTHRVVSAPSVPTMATAFARQIKNYRTSRYYSLLFVVFVTLLSETSPSSAVTSALCG
jgi:hypothetical protein